MAKKPEDRYQTAAEFISALNAAQQDPPLKWRLIVASIVIVLLGLGGLVRYQLNDDVEPIPTVIPAVTPEPTPTPTPLSILTVEVEPSNARVRIMNIPPKYRPGIPLPPRKNRKYRFEISAEGFQTIDRWIKLEPGKQTLPFELAILPPSESFRDRLKNGKEGPEMIVIPAGSFKMGDIQDGGDDDEKPVHTVDVKRFAMGKYEVTVAQFREFVTAMNYKTEAEKDASNGCATLNGGKWVWTANLSWRDPGYAQTDNDPVVCVSWNDARDYIVWLNKQTGLQYRLPNYN